MQNIGQSRFWLPLWQIYLKAPSIALCRIPELEYASTLDVSGPTLDHCCGDGQFASLAWPGKILSAGCDIDKVYIEQAWVRGNYRRVDCCDVSQRLPYEDASFDLVFNNSALEHVLELDGTLLEVARILKSGGMFAFALLNHRFYSWWDLGNDLKQAYQKWQPIHHIYTAEEWEKRLARAGLKLISLEGYFDKKSARKLAKLDCEFSGFFLAKRPSTLVWWYRKRPHLFGWYWRKRLAPLTWKTEPDAGAGYFIKAVRV